MTEKTAPTALPSRPKGNTGTTAGLFAEAAHPMTLISLPILAVLIGWYLVQCASFMHIVIDDAYISFRFVDNFVKGYGWRFNPTGPRVEGFTNFLWAACLLVPHKFGWDLMLSSKVLGMACGSLSILASWRFARWLRGRNDLFNLIPPAILATNSYFAFWAMMGLETLMQVMLVVACYWRFLVEMKSDSKAWLISPFIAVLAGMTRIDSLYYLFPLGLFGVYTCMEFWWKRIAFGLGAIVPIGLAALALVSARQEALSHALLWAAAISAFLLVCAAIADLILNFRAWRRFVIWAGIAAVAFSLYWSWKWTYFGDFFPNTYYAKQRLVTGSERGVEHLNIYYFHAADFDWQKPETDRLPVHYQLDTKLTFFESIANKATRADAYLNDGFAKWLKSLFWMNYWLFALLGAVLATLSGIVVYSAKKKPERDYFGPTLFLVLVPIAMHCYYILHVDGDWMPSFRFFQIVLPFLGVAGAVAFGFIYEVVRAFISKPAAWIAAGILSFAAAAALIFAVGYEQSKIESVYVFGKNSVYWAGKQPFWYLPEKVSDRLNGTFSPPLREVADRLLLETVDDGYIFMSDIGQPLWFAEHLNLYDVDGLTDPYLAHAPSTRGDIPTQSEFYDKLVAGFRATLPEAERDRDLTPGEQTRYAEQARRQEFERFLDRNQRYVMEERSPEYLLIFLNHETSNPESRGWPYPEISARIYNHPNFAEYEEDWKWIKTGRAYNHIYRRQDVPKEIPAEKKVRRLLRAVERNPRMPYLVGMLYEESLKAEHLPTELTDEVSDIVDHTLERWKGDPVVSEIARASTRYGKSKLSAVVLERSITEDPSNLANYWAAAQIYQGNGDFAAAAKIMERALLFVGPRDNSVHYHLVWLLEQAGEIDRALAVAQEAIDRDPKDVRAVNDRGAMLERLSRNGRFTAEERATFTRRAIADFESVLEIGGGNEQVMHEMIARMKATLNEAPVENAPVPVERRPPPVMPETRYDTILETRYDRTTETRYDGLETQYRGRNETRY